MTIAFTLLDTTFDCDLESTAVDLFFAFFPFDERFVEEFCSISTGKEIT